ncbi:MAG: extracellular solute-binding protein [Methylacidiphilales bacterium]|nr:extracellular solute-binding protein [Candidatus Methylacidiphilales bacterium]MDW8350093.1 extracellular solute-binding protein [Verrucomicrobiae bacterium]
MSKHPIIFTFLFIILLIDVSIVMWWFLLRRPPPPPPRPELPLPRITPLRVWAYGNEHQIRLWQSEINAFQRSTRQPVSFTYWSRETEYLQNRDTTLSPETSPDVFLTNSNEIERLYRNGRIRSFPFLASESTLWFAPALLPFRRGSEIIAYPSDFNTLMLYYNKDHFDRIRTAYPDEKWSWDVLIAVSRALERKDEHNRTQIWGIEYPLTYGFFQCLVNQFAGAIFKDGRWIFGDPQVISSQLLSLRFLIDLRYTHQTGFIRSPRLVPTQFEQGRASMLIAGSEVLPALKKIKHLRWGVSPLPVMLRPGGYLEIYSWAVSAHTNNPRLAQLLAQRLSRYGTREDRIPAYKVEDQLQTPELRVFYLQAQRSETAPIHPLTPDVQAMIQRELSILHQGKPIDAHQILNRIKAQIITRPPPPKNTVAPAPF